jgi:hypothetical protein
MASSGSGQKVERDGGSLRFREKRTLTPPGSLSGPSGAILAQDMPVARTATKRRNDDFMTIRSV